MSSDRRPTPGPWAIEDVNSDYLHDICLGYQVPGAGNPILLATVYFDEEAGRPGDITVREADANARLIAAAPDLLAACEEWLEADGPHTSLIEQQLRWDDIMGRMRAAVAKALGGKAWD